MLLATVTGACLATSTLHTALTVQAAKADASSHQNALLRRNAAIYSPSASQNQETSPIITRPRPSRQQQLWLLLARQHRQPGMAAAAAVQLDLQQMQLYLTWASQHHLGLTIPQASGNEAAQLQWSPNPLYMPPGVANEVDSVHNEMLPLQLHLQSYAAMEPETEISIISPATHSMPSATQVTPADTTQHNSTAGQVDANIWATAAAQPLAEVPCEVPTGPGQCCEHCEANTSQLTAALLDANVRVNVARTQLLAAQADMSMLLGEHIASLQSAALALPILV